MPTHVGEPQQQQLEVFDDLAVDKHWFHVTRAMFNRGMVAEMGAMAYTVYCAIKAHTALDTGRSWPSQQRIADQCAVSIDTVARATERLIELGYVKKERAGRRNEYTLIEKVPLAKQETGRVVAQAEMGYVPLRFQKEIEEIERFVKSGTLAKDSRVQITFNVNVIHQEGDHSVVNIGPTEVADLNGRASAAQAEVQRRLDRLRTIDAG